MKKLNKKGFTLIELLAVLAILTILMLLVTPSVLSMFSGSREKAFITEGQSLWKAAESAYIKDSIDSANPGPYCSKDVSDAGITCKQLNGVSSKIKYFISFTDKGQVVKMYMIDSNFYIKDGTDNISFDATAVGTLTKLTCTTTSGSTTCVYQ